MDDKKFKGTKWRDLPDKEHDVYVPLLTAFKNELLRINAAYPELPQKMVEYLLCPFDFYKVISVDNKCLTQIQSYNLRGTLNQSGIGIKPKIIVPIASLPTRIVHPDFKQCSDNKAHTPKSAVSLGNTECVRKLNFCCLLY